MNSPRACRLASVFAVVLATTLLAPLTRAQGTPVGFAETWALASDREAALQQLIPGSEEHYYYSCRLLQDRQAFGEVPAVLAAWIQRHGRTARVIEIENRQALLGFDRDPAGTYAFLRDRLGLTFDHQRDVPGAVPDLPTRLDPQLIAESTLLERALQQQPGQVQGPTALLLAHGLSDDQLMHLLGRLRRPDVPGLPALILRNLEHRQSRGFGSLAIHKNLLLAQLEELVRLRPALRNEPAFVDTVLRRLWPSADVRWQDTPADRLAYLERLQAYTDTLSPAHNSLKAHVLYHRLQHDLAAGTVDQARLLAYLALPRATDYANPEHRRELPRGAELVDGRRDYPTGLPAIGDDEPLVRACLQELLARADDLAPFARYVQADWLRRLLAETRILQGTGDRERWYSLLDDPAYYEQLRQRVTIAFPPTQRRRFAVGEPVRIAVDVKNVPRLLVKVFAINTFHFHAELGREVDAGVNLDGLVANQESAHDYQEDPLRQVRREFDFPALAGAGTWVVEFVGNGIASRVLIEKGRLQFVERLGAAGHVFRVLDEQAVPLADASIWFGGRDYPADEDGEITLPFASEAGNKTMVLRHGELTALARFQHQAESYALLAGVHVERETVLAGRKAKLLLRPMLTLNGQTVSLSLLEEPVLRLTVRDKDGVGSVEEVRGPALVLDRETVHEFTVPDGAVAVSASLGARLKNLRGEPVMLGSEERTFPVNGIDATDLTACPLLGRLPDGYVLDVLGKNGEPIADRAVQVELWHKDFPGQVSAALKTDGNGRIALGPLPGITTMRASGFPGDNQGWSLLPARRTWPAQLHGRAGQTLRLPWLDGPLAPITCSLLEVRNGVFVRDAYEHLALAQGFLELRGLPAGDYDLRLEEPGVSLPVRITDGPERVGYAIGRDRGLELPAAGPLHIVEAALDQGSLTVRLVNAGPAARVHVVATRYLPVFDAFGGLAGPSPSPLRTFATEQGFALYHAGREIGDEYRYILERRFGRRFPGNMLARPSLLLNPLALAEESWNEAIGLGGGAGGAFGGRRGGRRSAGGGARNQGGGDQAAGTFPNLDFLPRPAAVVANLVPDRAGVVRVPVADLGEGQHLTVLALDLEHAVTVSLLRPETPLQPVGRELQGGLDPSRHFVEQRKIEFVAADATATIDDRRAVRIEVYDSLAAVHRLFTTLSGDAALAEFAFVLRWPQLTPAEKQELYGKHACHELNFFLHRKDPQFFGSVVRPYLQDKLERTFLDQWLLGDDLTAWLEPRAFARLNTFEQILLAQGLPEQRAAIARLVQEQVELLPPDPVTDARLFASALRAGELGGADAERLRGLRLAADEMARFRQGGEQDRAGAEPFHTLTPKPNAPGAPPPPAAAAPRPERKAGAEPAESPVLQDAEVMELKEEAKSKAEGERGDDKLAEKAGKDAAPDNAAEGRDLRRLEQLEKEVAAREDARVLYQPVGATEAYVERNWWGRPRVGPDLVQANAFWRDYARHQGDGPFVSTQVARAAGSFAEMLLALAVLDLPFTPGEHRTAQQDGTRTLRPATPLLLVRRELAPVAAEAAEGAILLSQDFYRLDERYRYVGQEQRDAFVSDEFLKGVAYGCQVVVTNPTSTPRKLELLLQIPQGSIPVRNGAVTRGVAVHLPPYGTTSLDYAFYFPAPGTFAHYPVHATDGGTLAAFTEPRTFRVLREPTRIDTASWEHVSQNGGVAEVLAFLDGANLQRTDLARIAWRMADRGAFDAVLGLLRQRHVYSDVLWSYGIRHQDARTTREYLRHRDGFLNQCGAWLDSPLVVIDPVERETFRHVEFEPLFHSRAHRVGRQYRIANADVARQYLHFLDVLGYRPQLDSDDWLGVCYHMLLQDRVAEAFAAFGKVGPEGPHALQRDYLKVYLAFYRLELGEARSIAEPYRDHPVPRWRERFRAALGQLDEAEGLAAGGARPGDRDARQDALAAQEPVLELTVTGREASIACRNLTSCEVAYYEMDVEFLFSTRPFVQQESGGFAFIKPNLSQRHDLTGRATLALPLPAALQNANFLLEVRGGGLVRREPVFANALLVRMMEGYGQLDVSQAASGRPLPGTYVKVYARMGDGRVLFHKDGYTDLRGRFDYASVSSAATGGAQRFAILVLSEADGAVIREVAPPAR